METRWLRADLLAVEGKPLDRITDLERVQIVVCNGKVVVSPPEKR